MMTLTKLCNLSKLVFLSLKIALLMLSIQCGNSASLQQLPFSNGFCGCHLTPVFTVFVEGFDYTQLTEAEAEAAYSKVHLGGWA